MTFRDRARKRKMVAIMKNQTTRTVLIAAATLLLLAVISMPARAQTQPQQTSPEPGQAQANQTNQSPNFARELNLTPDQIQKIRAINLELKDQRQAANLRQRQAQQALDAAIESATPDEALIEQRSRELAEAHATTIRLRSLTEARILQVLTTEQRVKLKEIREKNKELGRGGNQQLPRNGLNQRNANTAPPFRPNQRKLMRQQPKH